MKFYLLRHGETEWNKLGKFQGLTDVSLNDRGLAQARDSARAALSWEHNALYASSLTRTVQVAEEIHKLTGIPLVTDPGLRELSLGDLEGVTGAEMRAGWPGLYQTWRNNPADVVMPNGESLTQLQERAWDVILEIERGHADEEGVVVFHTTSPSAPSSAPSSTYPCTIFTACPWDWVRSAPSKAMGMVAA